MFHVTNFTESSESHMPLDKLVKTSMLLWDRLREQGVDLQTVNADTMSEVAANLATMVYENKFGKPIVPIAAMQPEEQAVVMLNAICSNWFGLWGMNAFPRVQMSHSFAAMLMATTISPKELPHVEAPWPAFLIEVPDGLLPLKAKDGTVSHITRVHVVSHLMPTIFKSERWWGFWLSGMSIEVLRAGTLEDSVIARSERDLKKVPLKRMPDDFERADVLDMPVEEDFWDGYDRSQEERISILVGRLVIGICTLMTERANYTERVVKLDKSHAPNARRINKQPEARIYTVGRPVKLDVRLALRHFIDGTRPAKGPLTIQRLVAGHHKWQPHGPKNSLRKWIFIEPYWQGPDEAPIVVRPHVGTTDQDP